MHITKNKRKSKLKNLKCRANVSTEQGRWRFPRDCWQMRGNAFREINNAMWDEALEARVIRDGSKGYLLKI